MSAAGLTLRVLARRVERALQDAGAPRGLEVYRSGETLQPGHPGWYLDDVPIAPREELEPPAVVVVRVYHLDAADSPASYWYAAVSAYCAALRARHIDAHIMPAYLTASGKPYVYVHRKVLRVRLAPDPAPGP